MKFRKLKYKISFYFIGLILCFGAASGILFLSKEHKTEVENYKNTCSSILKNVEPNIARLLYLDDRVELNRMVNRIKQSNSDFIYCFVLDADKKVVVHTFANGFPSGLLSVNTEPVDNTELLEFENSTVYDFSYPIVDGKLGTVRIGVSRERLMGLIIYNLIGSIVLLLLFVMAGVMISFYISHLVTSPLNDLVESAERISRGDFDHKVQSRSHDEIGKLSDAFNTMSSSLKNMTETLEVKIMQLNEKNEEYLALNEEYEAQNRELFQAKEYAEKCDRLKTAFLANLSHEIRTPMNGILGFAELLKSGDITKDSKDEYIEVIEESGQRMLRLISELIDISWIESGQLKFIHETVNVSRLLDKLFNFFKPQARKKGIELILEKTENEPELFTDSLKLEQIISNLLSNAIKFTSHGKIRFGYNLFNNKILFTVKDTGKGIPADMLNEIFERFRQVDDVNHKREEGSGLGLAICKSFVELMGGRIWVDSEVNKGSSFYFTLPCTEPETGSMVSDSSNARNKDCG